MPHLRKGTIIKIDQEDQNGGKLWKSCLIQQIQKYLFLSTVLNLTGVTTNPTILKRRSVKLLLAYERNQNNRTDSYPYSDNRKNGRRNDRGCSSYHRRTGKDTFIKVPVNQAGLQAIKSWKEGYLITGTAIYTELQGYLAINNGADYIAPYYNRMQNQGIDAMKWLIRCGLRSNVRKDQQNISS